MKTKRVSPERLGAAIRRHRTAAGLTLRALAIKVDADQVHIWRLEKGRSMPSLDMLCRLADALNTDISTLVDDAP